MVIDGAALVPDPQNAELTTRIFLAAHCDLFAAMRALNMNLRGPPALNVQYPLVTQRTSDDLKHTDFLHIRTSSLLETILFPNG